MTSKELLNKVLNIEIVSYQMKQKNILAYEYNKVSKNQWSGKTFCNRSINIYELANKCKEWAEGKGYYMMSGTWALQDGKQKACIVGKPRPLETFISDTEVEAILKAVEYILTQLKETK